MSRLSRETEALLERGRRGPSMTLAHRSRLRGAILAKAAGGAMVATATSAAAWTSMAAKVVGAVALVAAAGAGVAMGTGGWSGKGDVQASANANANATATANATANANATAPAPPTATAATAPATPVALAPAPATPLPTTPAAARASAPAAPVANATALSSPAPAPPPAEPAPSASSPLSTLELEARLLHEADRALKSGAPDRALALLAEHAASYPRSALEPERSAERVFALCKAGRADEARAEAGVFLQAHPAGPLAERVRGGCEGADR